MANVKSFVSHGHLPSSIRKVNYVTKTLGLSHWKAQMCPFTAETQASSQKPFRRIFKGSLESFSAYLFQQSFLNKIKIVFYYTVLRGSEYFYPLFRCLYIVSAVFTARELHSVITTGWSAKGVVFLKNVKITGSLRSQVIDKKQV